ncbi:MAG: hypothetical protein F6J93_37095 [Oscillatoria sp. SIO1A7]|nr:hypothetical protein [Oscillatoria sp. SIO1A7]
MSQWFRPQKYHFAIAYRGRFSLLTAFVKITTISWRFSWAHIVCRPTPLQRPNIGFHALGVETICRSPL